MLIACYGHSLLTATVLGESFAITCGTHEGTWVHQPHVAVLDLQEGQTSTWSQQSPRAFTRSSQLTNLCISLALVVLCRAFFIRNCVVVFVTASILPFSSFLEQVERHLR